MRHEGLLHVKKAQFLAPADCRNILMKVAEAAKPDMTILCERGSAFGYGNLVVDMLGIPEMKKLGAPVTIDATHAVRSEEHTSELQSLMRISYAVFCLKKKNRPTQLTHSTTN